MALGIAGILIIFLSEYSTGGGEKESVRGESDGVCSAEYCEYLEDKVTQIVESIEGAGKARVMITISETEEYIYATNEKDVRKNTEKSNDINNQSDYVIIDKNSDDGGLLLKTIEPKVRGVAVVCEGGNDTKVQEQIYSAVGAVLNVSISRISISKLSATEEHK